MSENIGRPGEANQKREDVYGHWRGGKLKDFLPLLEKIASNDIDAWYWGNNMDCKYLRINIDTRDGGFVTVYDDKGKMITHDEAEKQ